MKSISDRGASAGMGNSVAAGPSSPPWLRKNFELAMVRESQVTHWNFME